jgi:predicted DNA-binding protein (MmcQ/YjbR family)
MDGPSALAWCRAQPRATEERPFGPETCVFKVAGRVFAILPGGEAPSTVSLKCDPHLAETLRGDHPDAIIPGYHLNKRHWNTVRLDAGLPAELLRDLLEHSFTLVVDGLPRAVRDELRRATSG